MPSVRDIPSDWNEIRTRATNFVKDHKNDSSEQSEKQTFWNEFFYIFGIDRKRVATFEKAVKRMEGLGFIDLFWPGKLIVEHKSLGKSLESAFDQAIGYTFGLKNSELPTYIITSDFRRFRLENLESSKVYEFKIEELVANVEKFGFIAGYEEIQHETQDPVNIKAAEEMAKLHDSLKEAGYEGHELEVYLVRLVFCLFAENTGIFDKKQFWSYLHSKTTYDGTNLANELEAIFQILDTPDEKRMKNVPELLRRFQYINGDLFKERLPMASFDSKMRTRLLASSNLDWSKISPAIFGSLFQGVMNPEERREIGAHYTSEENIMKLIRPLFLDDLKEEFSKISNDKLKLETFWNKLASIKILDPACGCGNFLIIAYRELRLLEMDVMAAKYGKQTTIGIASRIDVDQFYGIELEEFPCEIARVAMWLMDHLMNLKMRDVFGIYEPRIPLKAHANILHANSLRTDWTKLVNPKEVTYIIGNPPFVGRTYQDEEQRKEMASLFPDGAKILDYVAAWYLKATDYMLKNPIITVGFVSTNSITQGEQTGPLWKILFGKGVKIHFAYSTFKWNNEAKGKAAVHCVIIGFGLKNPKKHTLFYHSDGLTGHVISKQVKRINPYLVDADDILLEKRSKPISGNAPMNYGSFALDDGNYTISAKEYDDIIVAEPRAKQFLRPFIGARELIHNEKRYCVWLLDADPSELEKCKIIKQKVDNVRKWRSKSDRKNTRLLAETPTLFAEIRQPNTSYLAVPTVSSENRKYIPIAYLDSETIASNQIYVLPDATLYHFGVLTSSMHMAWTRAVCGRLKSDFRYSSSIVYNNFPWPDATEKQKEAIEKAVKEIFDVRLKYPNSSLATLYNFPMPVDLLKAHSKLDREVEKAYTSKKFETEADMVSFLFSKYKEYLER